MAKGKKGVANIQKGDRGTKLISQPGFTHSKQPQGKSIGAAPSKSECGYGRSSHHADFFKNK